MDEFITWETLATYAGALAMVMILTQFTKNLNFSKKLPTQIWSYILALTVMLPATIFTAEVVTMQIIIEVLFNAIIVSLAANGGYSAIQRGRP